MAKEKKERNDLIRKLYKEGTPQHILAKRFNVNQTRVSSIIHFNKNRGVMRCRYCYDLASKTKDVCQSCFSKNRKQESDYRIAIGKERAASIQERLEKRLEAQRQREFLRLKEHERVVAINQEKIKTLESDGGGYTWEEFQRRDGREHVRTLVRIRDKFTCQDCKSVRLPKEIRDHNSKIAGLKGRVKNFDVHHINGLCGKKSSGYDRVGEMDGLVTLCHECHFNRPEHRVKSKEYAANISRRRRTKASSVA